jgi:hypothetical protein
MGQQHNGHGLSWAHCAGDTADCYLPPFPDGVKFYGVGTGACHDASHTGVTNPTQFIGINFLFRMFSLQGTNNVDMECLDITQLATCTSQGKTDVSITNTSLTGNVATYSWTWSFDQHIALGEPITVTGTTNGGGVFNVTGAIITSVTNAGGSSGTFTVALTHADVASAADTGTAYFANWCDAPGQSNDYVGIGIVMEYTVAQGPSNATLKDISIHGLKSTAILGSKFNTAPTDTFTASDIYIAGNGESGWDADGGGCGNSCESQGTMNISYLTSLWNGSCEVHPNGGTIGGNGYACTVDQAYGGNGDNVVMIATGGTWHWAHITSKYSAQDGFDSLHVGDDPLVRPTLTMTDIYAEGNEGQSIKGGGGQATLTNSIGIANCNIFANASNFPLNPPGWNALAQLRCRANDGMAFGMQDGDTLTIENVTNNGEQNVAWDIANANCSTTTACTLIFKNNTTMSFISPFYGTYAGAFNFGGPDPFANPASSAANNAWYHMGNSGTTCPGDGHEINYVCTDPKFVAESDVNAIDAHLTSISPLVAAGVSIPGLTTDYAGTRRPYPPSDGAYEYLTLVPYPVSLEGGNGLSGATQLQ